MYFKWFLYLSIKNTPKGRKSFYLSLYQRKKKLVCNCVCLAESIEGSRYPIWFSFKVKVKENLITILSTTLSKEKWLIEKNTPLCIRIIYKIRREVTVRVLCLLGTLRENQYIKLRFTIVFFCDYINTIAVVNAQFMLLFILYSSEYSGVKRYYRYKVLFYILK